MRVGEGEPMSLRWQHGDTIVWREVLNDGRPWLASTVYVVEDAPEHLITYLPTGAQFGFPDGDFPSDNGRHPWEASGHWQGHGCLQIAFPDEAYAIWHFWSGQERSFAHWYLNLQEPFRRTNIGLDTQDLELDIVVHLDGSWESKDDELLDRRVEQGRYTAEQVAGIRAVAGDLDERLQNGRWWDDHWTKWEPEPDWTPQPLPRDWMKQ